MSVNKPELNKSDQLWVVEFTSVHAQRDTSFFWTELKAQQFYDFCEMDAAPKLYVTDVSFTEVAVPGSS